MHIWPSRIRLVEAANAPMQGRIDAHQIQPPTLWNERSEPHVLPPGRDLGARRNGCALGLTVIMSPTVDTDAAV